ncbi:MAG: cobalamin-dependent protein [Candidatus Methanofastidiosia archaeon]
MNCDMLFIHPSAHPTSPQFIVMPMGIFSIMGQLHTYKVKAVNIGLELCLNKTFDIKEFLKKHAFDFVGIDLHWHEHAYTSIETARICKEINPECTVILGGVTASYFAEEILTMCPDIDMVVMGEAEEIIPKIVAGEPLVKIPNLVYKENGIHKTPVQSVSQLEFDISSITHLYHWEEYLKTSIHDYIKKRFWYDFWVCTGRGCDYNCSYCGGAKDTQTLFKRNGITFRPIESVIKDLVYLQDLGVHVVCPSHDISLNKEYWQKLFERMKQEKIYMGMYLEVWQLPDKEFIDALATVCDPRFTTIAVTLLSGSESIREQNGKYYTNKEYYTCLKSIETHKMNHVPYFATGLPFETEKTFEKTMDMTKKIVADFRPSAIFCTPLRLDPGSPMYENPDVYKIVKHFNTFEDYYTRCKRRAEGLSYDFMGYHTDFLKGETISRLQHQWETVIQKNPVMTGTSMDKLHFL